MATISFNINDDKLPIIVEALCDLYPIPKNSSNQFLFTPNQWSKECIRRWIIKQVARYNQSKIISTAVYNEIDDLLS
jgi:hypothetical protein